MSEYDIRFKPGDKVQVRRAPPEAHCRTPWYLRGRMGTVAEIAGVFRNPSLLAFHKPGLPKLPLYRVEFRHCDVFDTEPGPDKIVADLYDHWLQPVAEENRDAP
jgi:nitrile hydratase